MIIALQISYEIIQYYLHMLSNDENIYLSDKIFADENIMFQTLKIKFLLIIRVCSVSPRNQTTISQKVEGCF
jgi:hypothetical protein